MTPSLRQPDRASPVKPLIKRKSADIETPSISRALSGTYREEKDETTKIPEDYARTTRKADEAFTQNDLWTVWPEFAARYTDQAHLYDTLSELPELIDDHTVRITVENSVQCDRIRGIKPEMIGFLRKILNNTQIDVHIVLEKSTTGTKLLTDEQKLQAMMQKNPALQKMKNLFHLDF
ncbi:MAG TPA: hypothetical protein PLK12_03305 [Prolixibacteraceae bacterium]|nr:hypothetical protein [Prolixibacteraceae bacterium]